MYTFLILAFTILSAHPNFGCFLAPGAQGSNVANKIELSTLSLSCYINILYLPYQLYI
jgi:hypothetical protein